MLTVETLQTDLFGPIDLTLARGRCATISGPSGAGKSLFLRAIADLDEAKGSVTLNGRHREAFEAPEWRRRVAYVPAESGWWHDRVDAHFQPAPDLSELLQAVALPDAMNWQVGRLSTGEKQRLGLVRALQLNPDVLLLDEPTSALDPPATERVEALLRSRLEAGCAMLLVSHDPGQPDRLNADRYLMEAGRLINPGTRANPA